MNYLEKDIKRSLSRRKKMASMRQSGMTLQAIGNKYGISRQRVNQLLKIQKKKRPSKRECAYCGARALVVDHVIPQSGLTDGVVVDCCFRCNAIKSSKEVAWFLNYGKKFLDFERIRNNPSIMNYVTFNNGIYKQKETDNGTRTPRRCKVK